MVKVLCNKCGYTKVYCVYPNNVTYCYKCQSETKQPDPKGAKDLVVQTSQMVAMNSKCCNNNKDIKDK